MACSNACLSVSSPAYGHTCNCICQSILEWFDGTAQVFRRGVSAVMSCKIIISLWGHKSMGAQLMELGPWTQCSAVVWEAARSVLGTGPSTNQTRAADQYTSKWNKMWSQAFDLGKLGATLGEGLQKARDEVDRQLGDALARAKAEAERLESALHLDGHAGEASGAQIEGTHPTGKSVVPRCPQCKSTQSTDARCILLFKTQVPSHLQSQTPRCVAAALAAFNAHHAASHPAVLHTASTACCCCHCTDH